MGGGEQGNKSVQALTPSLHCDYTHSYGMQAGWLGKIRISGRGSPYQEDLSLRPEWGNRFSLMLPRLYSECEGSH